MGCKSCRAAKHHRRRRVKNNKWFVLSLQKSCQKMPLESGKPRSNDAQYLRGSLLTFNRNPKSDVGVSANG